MINPHELRIGNYFNPCRYGKGILLPTSTIAVVQTIDIFQVRWVKLGDIPAQVEVWPDSLFNEMNPMPLTEEWLLKFGLRNDEYNPNCYAILIGQMDIVIFNWKTPVAQANGIKEGEYYMMLCNRIVILKYVHHFQNVIHSLTGEELTIKT